jgi:hypothetical protein
LPQNKKQFSQALKLKWLLEPLEKKIVADRLHKVFLVVNKSMFVCGWNHDG